MKSGLVAMLAAEGTISTLVGSRIFVNKAPQGAALPHIIITQMGTEENVRLDGSAGMRFVEFDIDCKADRSLESQTLGDAVRVFLDDQLEASAGSQTISAAILNGEQSSYEPPEDGSDTGVHNTLLDFTIQYIPA